MEALPMNILPLDPSDIDQLKSLISREKNAKQRDRLRAVLLGLEGQSAPQIARALGRARRFVQHWVYAYRDGGIKAIRAGKSTGQPKKLAADKEGAFRQRILAGPTESDGVCTLRGVDAQRILEVEFGAKYSLDGVYDLMHRLGLSCLSPRPRHRKNDPQAMARWVEAAPFLSRK
jgi:transposase